MKKFLLSFFVTFVFAFGILHSLAYSQESNNVALTFDLPAKRNLTTDDITINGRIRLKLSDRFLVEGNVTAGEAVQFLLNPPVDQIEVNGQMWAALNTPSDGKKYVRFWLIGGMQQNMLIGAADGTSGIGGVAVEFANRKGFHVIPKVKFTTKDFTNKTTLGEDFEFSTEIRFGSKEFAFEVEPYVSRNDLFQSGFYVTKYGAKLRIVKPF